jgi:hypothetical protein
MLKRGALLWLLCFGVYASTLGMHAFARADYSSDEPHYLLTAKSLVDDHSADLLDEYRTRAYDDFYPYALQPQGTLTKGFLNEPHGVGFPLLIAPAFAVGGAKAVEVFLAALMALAVVLAYAVALRVVPDPWAGGATLAVALSPPMLAYGSAVYPSSAAAAALTGATLFALRSAERPSRLNTFGCFLLLGSLPWLGTYLLIPGLPIAWYAIRALRVQRRRMLAIGGLEVLGFSLAFYAGLNNGLYGGLTPFAAALPGDAPGDADFPLDYLNRAYRFVALWIDRDYGLMRWAPILALAVLGLWLVLRERRAGLARVIPELQREESAATLCALVVGAQLLVATFLAPTMFGFWFPGRYLIAVVPMMVPLIALGVRRVPRTGAVLGLIGIAASIWLYIDVRWYGAGFAQGRPNAPFGPLVHVLPFFDDSTLPYVVAFVVFAAVAAWFLVDERVWRRLLRRERAPA